MKKCGYCERENEADALRCKECGSTEFLDSPITLSSGKALVACSRCGLTTEMVETFFQKKSLLHTTSMLCPNCWQKHKLSEYKWVLILLLIPGFLGMLYLILLPNDGIGWLMLNIFIFHLGIIFAVLPHEFGHAFVAKSLGWRVFRIIIGYGKPIFTRSLFGFETEFHAIPYGGLTITAPRDKFHFRKKKCLLIFAGPLTNGLLIVIIWIAMGGSFVELDFNVKHLMPLQMFLFSNILIMLSNLFPFQCNSPLGKISSDGRQLMELLKPDDILAAQNHAFLFLLESMLCQEKNQIASASSWLEKGLELYPENIQLILNQGVCKMYMSQFKEARECFLNALSRTNADRIHRSLTINNIAYTNILIGGTDFLLEADRYSLEAMSNLAWMPAIRGTRGTVLLELGKLDEAVSLLREVMQTQDVPANKAQNCCWLAIAEARRGNRDAGQKYLDAARNFDPNCFLIVRAQKIMGELPSPEAKV